MFRPLSWSSRPPGPAVDVRSLRGGLHSGAQRPGGPPVNVVQGESPSNHGDGEEEEDEGGEEEQPFLTAAEFRPRSPGLERNRRKESEGDEQSGEHDGAVPSFAKTAFAEQNGGAEMPRGVHGDLWATRRVGGKCAMGSQNKKKLCSLMRLLP